MCFGKGNHVASSLIQAVALAVCGAGIGLAGCKDKGDDKPAESTSEYVYNCKIGISKKATEFSANESDKDEKAATEKAWKAVCAKLPAEEQPNCRDGKRWAPSVGTAKMTTNVETRYGVTVKLMPNMPRFLGQKATSEVGHEAACAEAMKSACAAAGAAGDCVATGAFEKKEERKGKTHKMLLGRR